MHTYYEQDLGKYDLLVVDHYTKDIPDKIVVGLNDNHVPVHCLNVQCSICPVQKMCTAATGGPDLSKGILLRYCPDLIDKHPEYFI